VPAEPQKCGRKHNHTSRVPTGGATPPPHPHHTLGCKTTLAFPTPRFFRVSLTICCCAPVRWRWGRHPLEVISPCDFLPSPLRLLTISLAGRAGKMYRRFASVVSFFFFPTRFPVLTPPFFLPLPARSPWVLYLRTFKTTVRVFFSEGRYLVLRIPFVSFPPLIRLHEDSLAKVPMGSFTPPPSFFSPSLAPPFPT